MSGTVKQCFAVNLSVMKILCLYSSTKPTNLGQVRICVIYLLLTVHTPVLGILYFAFDTENLDLERIGDNAFAIAELACAFFKFLPFIINADEIRRCIHFFERPIFTISRKNQVEIMTDCLKISKKNSTIFLVFSACAISLFNIKPFFLKGNRFPVDVWLPMDFSNNPHAFYGFYFYITLGIFYSGIACAAIDPLIGGLAFTAAGQLRILKNNLEHLAEYAEEASLTETSLVKSTIIYNNICHCVEQHNAILSFVKLYEYCFSPVVFIQLSGSILAVCLCCWELNMLKPSGLTFFSTIACLVALLIQICFYCYYGTTLIEESNTITDAIFMGKWYDYDVKCKQALLIVMEMSKRPIIVTAGKILELSLVTFVTTLKRSYSLFAFLINQQDFRNRQS